MLNPKQVLRIRRVCLIAKHVLGLVLLVLEIVKRFLALMQTSWLQCVRAPRGGSKPEGLVAYGTGPWVSSFRS